VYFWEKPCESRFKYIAPVDTCGPQQPPRVRLARLSGSPPRRAALSFLYTLLLNDCVPAAEGAGLDPQVGFLHALRPARSGAGSHGGVAGCAGGPARPYPDQSQAGDA